MATPAGPHVWQLHRGTIRSHSTKWDNAANCRAAVHNQVALRRPDWIARLIRYEAHGLTAAVYGYLEQPSPLRVVGAGCHNPRTVRRPVGAAAITSRTLNRDRRGQGSCIRPVRGHHQQPQLALLP